MPGPGTVATQIAACTLPPYKNNVPIASQTSGTYDRGSVAFDGTELLYTEYLETGPVNDEGIIHRFDPLTCQPLGDIDVRFAQADLDRLSAAGNWCGTSRPSIDDLTYDPVRNVLWVSLQRIDAGYTTKGGDLNCYGTDGTGTWLFKVALAANAGQNPILADARLAFDNGCGYILSYDISSDTLWTCDVHGQSGSPTQPGRVQASNGQSVSTCMSQISIDDLSGMARLRHHDLHDHVQAHAPAVPRADNRGRADGLRWRDLRQPPRARGVAA